MLQSIRDRAQGWIAWIIVTLLIIPFALWGINEYFGNAQTVVVAKVADTEIELNQFQGAYQQYRQRLQAMLGSSIDIGKLNQDTIKQEALEQMVTQKLLQKTGQNAGMRISDEQVAVFINALDAFKNDGAFSSELYAERLRSAGQSPRSFEESLRNEMVADQLRQAIADSEFVTPAEAALVRRLNDQKRDIVYTIIGFEDFKSQVTVGDPQVETYYQSHPQEFMTEEMVKVSYVELSLDQLAKKVPVTDEAIAAYYAERVADFTVPEQRKVSQILVKLPIEASVDQTAAAKAKAEKILAIARGGKNLNEIAEQDLEAFGADVEFSNMGFMERGVMQGAFDDAMFALQPKQVSEVVKSDFGFHIIQLDEINPGKTQPLTEIREDVTTAYRRHQAEGQFVDFAEQLANLAYENPESLDPASDTLELPVKQSDYFSRSGGDGIFADPKLVSAAFEDEVLEERSNSAPIEVGDTHMVVLRVDEFKPAGLKPLAEVRETIRSKMTSEEAKKLAAERGSELLKRLAAGGERAALAAKYKFTWVQDDKVDRDDPNLNRAVSRAAFKLPKPAPNRPVYDGVALGNGDYAVLGVLGVSDLPAKDGTTEELARQKGDLLKRKSAQVWREFVAQLKDRSEVKIYEQNL